MASTDVHSPTVRLAVELRTSAGFHSTPPNPAHHHPSDRAGRTMCSVCWELRPWWSKTFEPVEVVRERGGQFGDVIRLRIHDPASQWRICWALRR